MLPHVVTAVETTTQTESTSTMSASYIPVGYTQSACKGCGGVGGDPRCVCKGRGYFNNPSRVYRRVDAQVADARRTLGFMSKSDVQSETEATLAKLRAK